MGLLLFLNGYSSAAGLHGGREGGHIGRYKHSHRPILLGCGLPPVFGKARARVY